MFKWWRKRKAKKAAVAAAAAEERCRQAAEKTAYFNSLIGNMAPAKAQPAKIGRSPYPGTATVPTRRYDPPTPDCVTAMWDAAHCSSPSPETPSMDTSHHGGSTADVGGGGDFGGGGASSDF